MKIPGHIKKGLVLLVIVTSFYLAYVHFFIKPSNFKYFSLVDDGQVLVQSSSYLEDCLSNLQCSKFIDQTFEFGTNRFRPTYWLINNFLYETFGDNPQSHHLFRVYVVGYVVTLLLFLILIDLRLRSVVVLNGVFLFVSNFSFSENIVRLGTNEPYQVLFLAIFSLIYLRYRKRMLESGRTLFILLLILIWTVFIKENSLVVLPAIFFTEYLSNKKNLRGAAILVALPFVLLVSGIVFTKYIPSSIAPDIPSYTTNYVTDLRVIMGNALSNIRLLFNSLSPFLKLSLFLLPLLVVSKSTRASLKNAKIYYWFLFAVFFTLILFPWRYVLERYQLISIFGLTILMSFVLDKVIEFLWNNISTKRRVTPMHKLFFELFVFWLVMSLFFRGLPINLAKTINYSTWFEGFTRFESEQVRAIATHNEEKVYINAVDNINNWEFLYEVPIHLKFLYHLDPNVQIVTESPTNNGYLFSRSSFDSVIELEKLSESGYEIDDSNTYKIDQIDPILFRKQFNKKPIRTILTPPLKEEGFDYYWEIRKL